MSPVTDTTAPDENNTPLSTEPCPTTTAPTEDKTPAGCPYSPQTEPKKVLAWCGEEATRWTGKRSKIYEELLEANELIIPPEQQVGERELGQIVDEVLRIALPPLLEDTIEITIALRNHMPLRAFISAPDTGIILREYRMRDGEHLEDDTLIYHYYISRLERTEHTDNPADVKYTVTFTNARNHEDAYTLHEKSTAELSRYLKNTATIQNRRYIDDAVPALIGQIVNRGLCKEAISIPATGFFLSEDGDLLQYDHHSFPQCLPPPDPALLEKALSFLDYLMDFHQDCYQAKALIYYAVQAPLSAIRRSFNRETRYLLAYDEKHTGKTNLGKYALMLWGVTVREGLFNASRLSAPQLAYRLNLTTFPQVMDEAKNCLQNPEISEMLKSSTTGDLIHQRNKRDLTGMDTFYSYSPLIITLNFLTGLPSALEERLIPVRFTPENKRPAEEASAFDRRLAAEKKNHAMLGSYLCEFFRQNWQEIIPVLDQTDELVIGYELLGKFCDWIEYKRPAWLTKIEVSRDFELLDHRDVLFLYLQKSYLEQLRACNCRDILSMDWDRRLDTLADALPVHTVRITKKSIALNSRIKNEVYKTFNHELPSFETLAKYVGGKVYSTRDQNGKSHHSLAIPRPVFLDYIHERFPGQTELK